MKSDRALFFSFSFGSISIEKFIYTLTLLIVIIRESRKSVDKSNERYTWLLTGDPIRRNHIVT